MRTRFMFVAAVFALLAGIASPAAAAKVRLFTVPPVDQVLDLHGDPQSAQLVIFAAGNQFMVMPELLQAFRRRHPEISRIYYETLPPGIVVDQARGSDLLVGNLLLAARADVLLVGPRGMREMQAAGYVSSWVPYASNQLAIMVRKGNPAGVKSLVDLGRNDVRVIMPNPKWEGVAEQVQGAYAKAGGPALVHAIMSTKLGKGTTILTRIHHRQTPLYIIEEKADAGPVWISEALYATRIGEPLSFVRIPPSQNVTAAYDAAVLRRAPHTEAARAFIDFMTTSEARTIYRSYGFGPPLR